MWCKPYSESAVFVPNNALDTDSEQLINLIWSEISILPRITFDTYSG